jgi:hypothetical protein
MLETLHDLDEGPAIELLLRLLLVVMTIISVSVCLV